MDQYGRIGRLAYCSHLWVELAAEVLKVRVLVPFQHTKTMLNTIQTLLWTSDCKLDHRSCLIRIQLELILLVRKQSADFHGEEASSLGLDQRSPPMNKINVVLLLEVLVN